MKLRFYIVTLLLLTGISLHAMEQSDKKEKKEFNLFRHANDLKAMQAVYPQTPQTAQAINDIFSPYECSYEYDEVNVTSLKSVNYTRQITPMPLNDDLISLLVARIIVTDRDNEEKAYKIIKYGNATTPTVLKDAKTDLELKEKKQKDNGSRWEPKAKYNGITSAGASGFLLLLAGVSAKLAHYISSKSRYDSLISVPIAIGLGATVGASAYLFESIFSFARAKTYPKTLQKNVEKAQLRYTNAQKLQEIFGDEENISLANAQKLSVFKAMVPFFVKPDSKDDKLEK